MIVALSVNAPLLRHPRCQQSMVTLREWGVAVIEPVDSGEGPRMAPVAAILAEARRELSS